MNKKIMISICVIVLAIVGLVLLVNNFHFGVTGNSNRLKVVATIFPQYDFVREVAGEDVDLEILINPGADSHAYEPSPADILKVRNADVFIYTGGHGDEWVERLLESADQEKLKVVKMSDAVDLRDEEEIGDEDEHEHGHEHGKEESAHDHDAAFTEKDIKDRTLAEFNGKWESIHPMLLNGDLDEYCEHKAEEDEDASTTKETIFEKQKANWACAVNQVEIKNDKITLTYTDDKKVTATYTYAGYKVKKSDSGKLSVRYQFQTTDKNAPKYVQFNDHGYKPSEPEHFHFYFGNQSFEAMMDSKTNSYFVHDGLDAHEVLDVLMGHEHSEHFDEHIWTSPKNAIAMVKSIESALCEAAPKKASAFHERAAAYVAKLEQLDADFREVVASAAKKTIVVADRFPLLYFVKEYGLEYHAAMSGCSSATEASAGVIAELIKEVKHEEIKYVYYIELSNQNMAKAVSEQTGAEMLLFHSCHNLSKTDFDNGCTYLSLMQQNVENLRKGLN